MTRNSDNKDLSERESGESGEREARVLTGTEVRTDTPPPLNKYDVEPEIELGSAIVQTVCAWIEGIRMRLKIKRDLGRKATEADLTSIATWIKVDEVEHRDAPDKQASID